MSQLLSISFDSPAAPALTLGQLEKDSSKDEFLYGWGFGWYSEGSNSAAILKNSEYQAKALKTQVFNDWKRFQSTLFLCHLRGAAKRSSEHDTQPFSRTYAGRSWVFLHNGDLDNRVFKELDLGSNSIFEPIGKTDSEHAFCWFLNMLEKHQIRKFSESNFEILHNYFKQINSFGTANLMVSDGHDMIVYHDKDHFNPIYWSRCSPPHKKHQFLSTFTKLEFDVTEIIYRTYLIFANEKSLVYNPNIMSPGQMMVARRGELVWNSHANIKNNKIPSESKIEKIKSKFTNRKKSQSSAASSVYTYQPRKKNQGSIVNISHITKYSYSKPVELSKHYFRLHPINDRYQQIIAYDLSLSTPCQAETFEDVFGNQVTLLQIDTPYSELIVNMNARINLIQPPELSRSMLYASSKIPLLWMPWERQMMSPYLLPPELPETQLAELTCFAMSFVKRNDYDVVDCLKDINQTIYRDFEYVSGSTNLETTPFEVLVNRRGVCQDFANLFICLARLLSIPARYRVGYIFTGADYKNKQQSEASHAWVEIYLPWLGWRGFDPTNGIEVGQDHVLVACGRNYFDATPTSGTLFKGGSDEQLFVNVKVERE